MNGLVTVTSTVNEGLQESLFLLAARTGTHFRTRQAAVTHISMCMQRTTVQLFLEYPLWTMQRLKIDAQLRTQ